MSKSNGILAALGQNVRREREAKQFTREKLAVRAGLDPTYISDIDRGLRNPGIGNVAKLAKPSVSPRRNSVKSGRVRRKRKERQPPVRRVSNNPTRQRAGSQAVALVLREDAPLYRVEQRVPPVSD